MPIARLPDDTTRLLGSTLVLSDATSVVKELVDNALDSGATSIAIEISANAADVIQVKDNGSGIGLEDRQLLCKRGCTSKIRNLEDLENLGGRSLGFRGEALASVVELSESATIITRVDGETVGTTMQFGPSGTMLSSASASHPIGTTLRIQNFLLQVPVRKQAASRNAAKILGDIKRLLFRYAFARPTVRLGFKVLKGKNEKANWTFAPCDSSEQLVSAAAKIIGKDIVSMCKQLSVTTSPGDVNSYRASALLLRPDADSSKLNHPGHYVVIDSRPVTADRGSMKDVAKLYKKYLQNARGPAFKHVSKPFMVLHLYCPSGSYDVNIEPAKDDVLFHDMENIVNLLRELFGKFYGDLEIEPECGNHKHVSVAGTTAPSFDLLLARKHPTPLTASPSASSLRPWDVSSSNVQVNIREHDGEENQFEDAGITKAGATPYQPLTAFRNMYDMDDEDEIPLRQENSGPASAPGVDEDESDAANSWVKNPFTTAALHARQSPRKLGSASLAEPHGISLTSRNAARKEFFASSSPIRPELPDLGPRSHHETHFLPTPSKSPTQGGPYQNPGPPIPRRSRRDGIDDEVTPIGQDISSQNSLQSQQDFFRRWAQDRGARTPVSIPVMEVVDKGKARHHESFDRDASVLDLDQINKDRATQPKPFRSPVKSQGKVSSSVPPGQDPVINAKVGIPASELDTIMAFEHRKKALNQRSRFSQSEITPAEIISSQREQPTGFRPNSTEDLDVRGFTTLDASTASSSIVPTRASLGLPPRTTQSPHQNRYRAALTSLAKAGQVEPQRVASNVSDSEDPADVTSGQLAGSNTTGTIMPQSDPRAYLITFQRKANSTSGLQIQRARSSRLPFETISKGEAKHNVMCLPSTACPGPQRLQDQAKNLSKSDEYVKIGELKSPEWNPFSKQVETWQSSLEKIMKAKYCAQNIASSGDTNPSRNSGDNSDLSTPVLEISLVRAIKCHLQMLTEQEDVS